MSAVGRRQPCKRAFLERVLSDADATVVQETRGSVEDLSTLLGMHRCVGAFRGARSAGTSSERGTIIGIRNSTFDTCQECIEKGPQARTCHHMVVLHCCGPTLHLSMWTLPVHFNRARSIHLQSTRIAHDDAAAAFLFGRLQRCGCRRVAAAWRWDLYFLCRPPR